MNKIKPKKVAVVMVLFTLVASTILGIFIYQKAYAASACYWLGTTSTSWNNAANWSSSSGGTASTCTAVGGVPIAGDTANFTSGGNNPASIDTAASIAALNINAGYTSTITIAAANSLTTSGAFTQHDGTFTTGDQAVTLGAYTMDGGVFNSGASLLTIVGNFTHTTATGTFNEDTGTVSFNNNIGGGDRSINVNTTEAFNNVAFAGTNSSYGYAIATGDNIVVNGTLTLTNGLLNGPGIVDANGDTITQAATFDGGSARLNFSNDALVQTYTIAAGSIGPYLYLDSAADASDSVIFSGAAALYGLNITSGFSGTVPITDGGNNITLGSASTSAGGFTLDANVTFDNQVVYIGTFSQSNGTFNATPGTLVISWNFTKSGGTFNAGPGTVSFNNGAGGGDRTIDVATTEAFNNVTFASTSNTYGYAIATGDNIVVNGTLTLTNGVINGPGIVDESGATITQEAGFDGGSARLNFADADLVQTYTIAAGSVGPYLYLDHAADANDSVIFSGAATLYGLNITSGFSGTVPITDNGNNISLGAGGFTLDASVTFSNQLVLTTYFNQSTGTFTAISGTLAITNSFTKSGGTFNEGTGTVNFNNTVGNPDRIIDVIGTEVFYNVIFNSGWDLYGHAIATGDTIQVDGTLTLTNGPLNGPGKIDAKGDVIDVSTFDGGTSPLTLSGTGNQTYSMAGIPMTGVLALNKDTGLTTLLNSSTTARTLTLSSAAQKSGGLAINTSGSGGLTLVGATNNPNVTLTGGLSFGKTSTGVPALTMGTATLWSATGDVNFTNATLTQGTSTLTLNGSAAQTITAGGTGAGHTPYNITVTNSSGPSNGVTFADSLTLAAGGTFTDTTGDSKLTFADGATFTFPIIAINGAIGHTINMTKGAGANGHWFFNVAQTSPTVTYVAVDHSDATGSSGAINDMTGGLDNGGNINWNFGASSTISGTVYTAENKSTNIGAGKTIALSINGAVATTLETTSGGAFTFSSVTVAAYDTVAVFVSGETEKGSLITQAANSGTDITGIEMYTNHIVLTYNTAGPMTNTLLATANTITDSDMLISTTTGTTTFTAGNTVWILGGKTYTPGGNVSAGSINILSTGTFSPEGNTVTLNDSGTPFVVGGTFTPSTSTISYTGGTTGTNVASATYNNLIVNHAGTIYTASGDITVSSVFTINAGTFDASSRTITLTGSENTPSNTPFVKTGTFTASTSTVKYTGAGATTITAATYYNLETSPSASPPSGWVVSGAGVEDHNGAYYQSGTYNGQPAYTNASGLWLWLGSGPTWILSYGKGSLDSGSFYHGWNGNSLLPANSWYVSPGAEWMLPAPTLAATPPAYIYTFAFGTFNINGNYTNGGGFGGADTTADTNDPTLNIDGNYSNSANATFVASNSASFTIAGNYTNSGTFTDSAGTLTLDGSGAQNITAGGTDASHDFKNLIVTNASVSGVSFADSLTLATGGTFTDTTPDSKLTFADGATFTFPIITINGAVGHTINMTKGAGANGHWHFNVAQASPTVTYVAVDHSDATASSGAINDTVGGVNNLNNINWNFPSTIPNAPTIGTATAGAGAGQATITFTPGSDGGSAITGYTVTSTPSSITGTGAGSPITVSGLANGTSYTFTVHATNAIGDSVESATSNGITTFAVPGAPTIGTATAGNAQASITFTPGSDGGTPITGYTVTSTPGSFTGTGAGSPITVNGLTNGTSYTFTVHATNIVGNGPESASSAPVTPFTVPSAPTIGTATAGAGVGQATVIFTPGSDGGFPITGYTVTSTPSSITGTGAGTPITVSGLANGTAYTFTVHATNANGNSVESAASNQITTFAVPGAPTIGVATAGNAQASVTFTPPGSDGGTPITGYTVISTPGSHTGTGGSSPIVVGSLTNGTAYTFTVHATNIVGNSAESGNSNPITPSTIPNAPTIGTATAGAGAGQATITFTPGGDGGSAITGYTVTSTPSSITGTGAGSPITVSGLANGTVYTFTVHATNAIGNSVESAASSSITTFAVPGAPTIGVATGGNAQASITFTPGSDGGTPITAYTVTSTPGSFTGTGASSPIDVNGLTNGTSYTFTVHATNIVGNGPESASSSAITPATVATVPGAPTGVSAVAGDKLAIISFTPPVDTGGSAITGYMVTSTPGGITMAGGSSPIIVTGLTNGTSYTFTVHATNANGNGPESAASASVTPTSGNQPTTEPETPGESTIKPSVPGESTSDTGQIKKSAIVPTETAPATDNGKKDIVWEDFSFYAVLRSGNVRINVSHEGKFEVVNNTNVLVEIPADIFAKKVNIITISTKDSTYSMNLLSDKNKYQSVIPMQAVKGDFELKILIAYEDGSIKEVKKNISVDPQGYVYTMSSNYFSLGKKQEMRIVDAKVTLYQIVDGKTQVWDSGGKQANPAITNKSGEYAFWVEPGEYYLTAEKAGYKTTKTDNIKVDNALIIQNVPIELKFKPWIWLILAGIVIVAIIFAVRRKKITIGQTSE